MSSTFARATRVGAVATTSAALLAAVLSGGGVASAQVYPPSGGGGTTSPSPSPSASASASASVSASPATSASPSASASASTSASPTPFASATPSNVPCQPVSLSPQSQRIAAGSVATVFLTGAPNAVFEVQAYTRPRTTYMVVRTTTTSEDGKATFQLTPPRNTRLFARQIDCTGPSRPSNSVVINVAKTVSVNARRVAGTRPIASAPGRPAQTGEYDIFGNTLPKPTLANETVTVYESNGGRLTKLGSAALASNGTYSFVRRFQRTGPITVVVRTDQNNNNASGQSASKTFTIRR